LLTVCGIIGTMSDTPAYCQKKNFAEVCDDLEKAMNCEKWQECAASKGLSSDDYIRGKWIFFSTKMKNKSLWTAIYNN